MGSNTVPWSTPEVTFVTLKLTPLTTTCFFLWDKKLWIHLPNFPVTPKDFSLCIIMPISHLSNAFEKSRYMLSTFFPFLRFVTISLWCPRCWASLDLPFLDPC